MSRSANAKRSNECTKTYALATLQRGGLANRLFPWARAIVYSESTNSTMLRTNWSQFKIGPLLRGERDKRGYHSLFCNAPKDLKGVSRLQKLITLRKVSETELLGQMHELDTPRIVVFTGLGDYFGSLRGHHALVGRRLWQITRPEHKPAEGVAFPVVLHVRRSDFGENMTPLSWFCSQVESLRDHGILDDVAVVSDGSETELKRLVSMRGVSYVYTGSAIGDLWVASRACVIIGSSHSTFSAWASYLGQSVTTYRVGGNLVGLEEANEAFVGASEEDGSPDFLEAAKGSIETMRRLGPTVSRTISLNGESPNGVSGS